MDSTPVVTAVAAQLKLSPTLQINEQVQQKLSSGHSVIHLGFGEATFPVQRDVLQRYQSSSAQTSYLPVSGLFELRESIAAYESRRLGQPVLPDQVVVAPGSKPILFALFDILEGDVLLPRPSWVSYEPQIRLAKKSLHWVETDEDNRHTISEASLRATYDKAIVDGSRPRIMLINSPSNPTGQEFTQENLDMITSFCRENKIVLISDEIYGDIHFSHHPQAIVCKSPSFNESRIVITGGLSKTYSAGGWRVGFMIVPRNDFGNVLKKSLLAYASESWSCAPAPAQYAAAVAFDTTPAMDNYRAQVAQLHHHCTHRLYVALRNLGLAVAEPQGSFYVYPSYFPYERHLAKIGVRTSLELSSWLIRDFGVAALPGSAFGEDDSGLSTGRLRLRMATSYLYFTDKKDSYTRGYQILEQYHSSKSEPDLPLLREAIAAIEKSVEYLKGLGEE